MKNSNEINNMADPTIVFNPVFRSWAVYGEDLVTPQLIIKTGFLVEVGTSTWPVNLHNFWVYDGSHILRGTLEPQAPDGVFRRFKFHSHDKNEWIDLPGGYSDMDGVILEIKKILQI